MDQELSTNLTLSDLKVISQLIEVCSVRGVFKASELTVVGDIYNKIAACLVNISNDASQDSKSSS